MNRDDIIRMAQEAGSIDSEEVIETVWNAFSAAEREACAKVCDGVYHQHIGPAHGEVRYGIAACAAAIRARGEK